MRESEPNEALFGFVWNSVGALDVLTDGVADFHLWFLANLSRFLGFCPGNEYVEGAWFDMHEGLYTPVRPAHSGCMSQECTRILGGLVGSDVCELGSLGLNRRQRVDFLDAMLAYFGYHLDAIGTVQSVHILREVFY